MRYVQAGVGNVHGELHVALHNRRFRSRRHAAQSQAERTRPRVHAAILGHARVFGVLHHRKIQLSAENQRLAHDAVIEDGLAIVGRRNRSGGLQRAEVGERSALAGAGRGRNGKHIDDRAAFRLTKPFDPLHRIDHRNRVRHGADRGKSTGGSGGRARRDRLFVHLSGLAQVHVQIDKAGSDDESTSIEFLVRTALDFVGSGDFGDATIFQQHVHRRVDARHRVDQMAAFDQKTGSSFFRTHRIFPIARARIAMRVGTPLCTSSRMRACTPSAISLVNSSPRMMGPGCITMASFFAIFNRAGVIW